MIARVIALCPAIAGAIVIATATIQTSRSEHALYTLFGCLLCSCAVVGNLKPSYRAVATWFGIVLGVGGILGSVGFVHAVLYELLDPELASRPETTARAIAILYERSERIYEQPSRPFRGFRLFGDC